MTTPPRSADRIRCRVDLEIASNTAVSSAPAPSGRAIRWRDGWISSIGTKPAARIAIDVARLGRRDFGIGGDDVDAEGGEAFAHLDEPPRQEGAQAVGGIRHDGAGGHRAARHVGAGSADHRPGPLERQDRRAVGRDEEPRLPTRRLSMPGPGHGLIDVPARRVDGQGVPVPALRRRRLVDVGHPSVAVYAAALPLVASPWRRRATHTRPRCPES